VSACHATIRSAKGIGLGRRDERLGSAVRLALHLMFGPLREIWLRRLGRHGAFNRNSTAGLASLPPTVHISLQIVSPAENGLPPGGAGERATIAIRLYTGKYFILDLTIASTSWPSPSPGGFQIPIVSIPIHGSQTHRRLRSGACHGYPAFFVAGPVRDRTGRAANGVEARAECDPGCHRAHSETRRRSITSNLAVTLGAVRDERARDVLWSFVEGGMACGQSLIVIAWRGDPVKLKQAGL